MGILLFLALLPRTRGELEITTEGLTLRAGWGRSRKVRHVAWKEARLFALGGYPGRRSRQDLPALYYELSSEQELLRWATLRRGYPRVIFVSEPENAMPEEYDRKMQVLLPVIAAKTGLPLYDLR